MLHLSPRLWLILVASASSVAMIFLDASILPVSLPTIARQLHLSVSQMHWIINIYFLTNAVFVIAGGRIADIYGKRRIFCIGMSVFALSSVVGGLALSGLELIIARACQGIGASMMAPPATALILDHFPSHFRGRVVGVLVSIGSVFLAIGPFLGGFLTQFVSWRLIFWMNLPIAIGGTILTLYAVPKSERRNESFDFLGFALLFFALGALILSVMQGSAWGWESTRVHILLLMSAFAFFLLKWTKKFAKHPFIDFALLKNKKFAVGLAVIGICQFLLMMTVFWSIAFQAIYHYTPFHSGLLTLISTSPIIVCAPLAGYLSDHYGAYLPVRTGFGLAVVVFAYLSAIIYYNFVTTFTLILPLFLFGCSIPMILTPVATKALSAVQAKNRGLASGMNNTARYFGASISIGILSAVSLFVQRKVFTAKLQTSTATAHIHPRAFFTLPFPSLSPKLESMVQHFMLLAKIKGFFAIHCLGLLLSIIMFCFVCIYFRKPKPHTQR